MAVAAAVCGARRPGAPSVGHRADPKRGNPVRNLRGPSSAAAFKFCGVIDACHPSAAALERSPPGNRARWTHARLMPGSTQSTAAVLPWDQGRCPWSFFPPISSGRNGGPGRAGPPREGAPPINIGRPQVAPTYGAPSRRAPRIGGSGENGRMLSAPTSLAVDIPAPSGTLTTIETEQERSHAASEHPHDAAISPHEGAAPGLHSVFPAG